MEWPCADDSFFGLLFRAALWLSLQSIGSAVQRDPGKISALVGIGLVSLFRQGPMVFALAIGITILLGQ